MAFSDQMAEFLMAAMESVASQLGDEVTDIEILCWHYWCFLYCT